MTKERDVRSYTLEDLKRDAWYGKDEYVLAADYDARLVEIERLKTANAQMLEHGREMWADVERLRAALENISTVRPLEHFPAVTALAYCREKALKALGAQDEPTSNPYKAGYLDALESARQVLEVQKNAVRGIEDFQPPVRTTEQL